MHLRSYQQLLCNAVALGDFCHPTKTCDRLRVILGLMLVLTTPPLKKMRWKQRVIFLCYCNESYYSISGKFNKCFFSYNASLGRSHSRVSPDRYSLRSCLAAHVFSHPLTFSETHLQNMTFVIFRGKSGLHWT